MAFDVEACEAGAAEAQLRVLATPGFGVEPKELATQLRIVRLDFEGLLILGDRLLELTTALGEHPKEDVRRDMLGVHRDDAFQRLLGPIEISGLEIRLAENARGLQIVRCLLEHVLSEASGALRLARLEPLPSLILGRLQAHACHRDPPITVRAGVVGAGDYGNLLRQKRHPRLTARSAHM